MLRQEKKAKNQDKEENGNSYMMDNRVNLADLYEKKKQTTKPDSALLTMTEQRGRRGGNEGKLWPHQEQTYCQLGCCFSYFFLTAPVFAS